MWFCGLIILSALSSILLHISADFFFKFYFIFKLYIIVLVLPNIKMNPPQVHMCSPSWTLLPPPSPFHPSGSSQCILLNYTIKSLKVNSQCLTFLIINYRTLSLLPILLPLSLWQALIYFLSLKNYSFWMLHISETIKCTIFCACQFSVSIIWRFIHVAVCVNSTTFSYSWRIFHCMNV